MYILRVLFDERALILTELEAFLITEFYKLLIQRKFNE